MNSTCTHDKGDVSGNISIKSAMYVQRAARRSLGRRCASLMTASCFSDFKRLKDGAVARSPPRRFSSKDVELFSALTGDSNYIHGGTEPIVHGLLVHSLVPALFAQLFPGALYVKQEMTLRSPVPVGAEVQAEIEIKRVRRRPRSSDAFVQCATRCIKGGSVVAIEGIATVLVPLPQGADGREERALFRRR